MVPGHLANPVWVDDPAFDITYHVRRSALPRPGSDVELLEFCARIESRLLDRGRPLWEMYLVEGLSGGRVAIVTKTHAAMVGERDGIDIAQVILDAAPAPRRTVEPIWMPGGEPSQRWGWSATPWARSRAVRSRWSTPRGRRRGTSNSTVRRATSLAGGVVSVGTALLRRPVGLAAARRAQRAAPAGGRPDAVARLPARPRRLRRHGQRRDPRRGVGRAARVAAGPLGRRAHGDVGARPGAGQRARAGRRRRGSAGGLGAAPGRQRRPRRRGRGARAARGRRRRRSGPPGRPPAAGRPARRGAGRRCCGWPSCATPWPRTARRDARSAPTRLAALSGFAPPTLHALGARAAAGLTRRMFSLVITNVPGSAVAAVRRRARG